MIEMSLSDADFQRSAAKAATNVQKILQSVSSLQRMVRKKKKFYTWRTKTFDKAIMIQLQMLKRT